MALTICSDCHAFNKNLVISLDRLKSYQPKNHAVILYEVDIVLSAVCRSLLPRLTAAYALA